MASSPLRSSHGVLAEHLGAPAMQGGDAVILVGGQFLDVFGIGDQARARRRRPRPAA